VRGVYFGIEKATGTELTSGTQQATDDITENGNKLAEDI
jgi:hypothetical protein